MHTHRANAAWLVETKQADYLLQVKANQPSVLEACQAIPDHVRRAWADWLAEQRGVELPC